MSWTATSADGKGRTLLDILLWRNAKKMGPVEFQYHNPFGLKVGHSVRVEHEIDLANIDYFVSAILVYETELDGRKFYDTEYELRGQSLGMEKPMILRLRVTPDDESADAKFPFRLQLLHKYDEFTWDENFYNYLLNLPAGQFEVNHDEEGNELDESRVYWRVNEVDDPYTCRLTTLRDLDRNGVVEEDELEYSEVTFWDFHRDTYSDAGQPCLDCINIEMDNDTHYFRLFRGTEVMPFQIQIL